jgi:hypothetical protein
MYRPLPGRLLAIVASAGLLAACGRGGGSAPTPSASLRPPPVVTIAPDYGPVGTVVAVSGSGFKPGSSLRASICAVDPAGKVPNYLFDCDLGNTVAASADARGDVHVRFTVKSVPHAIKGGGYHIGLGPVTGPDPGNDGGAAFTVDR